MVRIIRCESCEKHMGEIRDASLRLGMVVLCSQCNTARKIVMQSKESDKSNSSYDSSDIFGGILDDLMKGKK